MSLWKRAIYKKKKQFNGKYYCARKFTHTYIYIRGICRSRVPMTQKWKVVHNKRGRKFVSVLRQVACASHTQIHIYKYIQFSKDLTTPVGQFTTSLRKSFANSLATFVQPAPEFVKCLRIYVVVVKIYICTYCPVGCEFSTNWRT